MVQAIEAIADGLLRKFVPTTEASAVRCVLTKWEQGGVCGFSNGYLSYYYTKWFTCYPSNKPAYEQKSTQCGW